MMESIKVIQPIMDAAESLQKAEIIPEDQKFKVLTESLFKGRDVSRIGTDTVFFEILQEVHKIPSLTNEIIEDELLRSTIINNLKILFNFLKGYTISHAPLDKTVSDKLIKSLESTILEVEKLPIKPLEKRIDEVEVTNNSNSDRALEDLREATNMIQSASTLEEIQKGIDIAFEAKKHIMLASKERKNQSEVFIQAIEEKVHVFITKEIAKYSEIKKETTDMALISERKERLKQYEELAKSWSGSHQEYLLEKLDELNQKI